LTCETKYVQHNGFDSFKVFTKGDDTTPQSGNGLPYVTEELFLHIYEITVPVYHLSLAVTPLFSFTPTVFPLYSHTLSRSVALCSNKYCAKLAPKFRSVKPKKNNTLTCECRRVGESCTK